MPIETMKHSADFRTYLRAELIKRTKHNPKYSLRAFARSLNVQSGFLSKILLGQRRVTEATVQKFGVKLGLSPREIENFLQSTDGQAILETTSGGLDFKQIAYDLTGTTSRF
jgi:plasmid maintenance system antidote protein VapI